MVWVFFNSPYWKVIIKFNNYTIISFIYDCIITFKYFSILIYINCYNISNWNIIPNIKIRNWWSWSCNLYSPSFISIISKELINIMKLIHSFINSPTTIPNSIFPNTCFEFTITNFWINLTNSGIYKRCRCVYTITISNKGCICCSC